MLRKLLAGLAITGGSTTLLTLAVLALLPGTFGASLIYAGILALRAKKGRN